MFLGWSQDDQDAALTWQAHESRRCGSCGTHPGEWTHRDSWVAEPVRCKGCEQVQRVSKQVEKRSRDYGAGIHIRLRRQEE